jgi:hypothetical protein
MRRRYISEASGRGRKITLKDLYDLTNRGVKISIFNDRTDEYVVYLEYFKDVIEYFPELRNETIYGLDSNGAGKLTCHINSDFVRDELPNW